MINKKAADLVKAAKQEVENLTPEQVKEALTQDGVVLFDIREANELAVTGKINGSILTPRGMIEFYADPSLPTYKPEFGDAKKIILHCASGGRSALAAQTLQSMGYTNVAHLDGGLKAWAEAGLPVEK